MDPPESQRMAEEEDGVRSGARFEGRWSTRGCSALTCRARSLHLLTRPSHASPPPKVAPLANAPRRRVAVHASRDSGTSSMASKYSLSATSTERRLPTEGGPAAQKAALDVRVVAKAAEGIALFASVPKEDRAALFAAMFTFDYAPKEYIMRQGEEGRNFYIIVSGACVVTVTGEEGGVELEKSLGPGDTFGEVALLHGGVRSASVRAGSAPVKVWVLGRATFRQTLSDAAYARRKKYADLLAAVKPLASLTPYAREQLADAVVARGYAPGDVILEQGSLDGARFHILERGSVRVAVGGAFVAQLGPGDYFGELCLLGSSAAPTATVSAASEGAKTISLDRSSFRRMLGEEVQEALGSHIKTYVFQDGAADSVQPASLGGDRAAAIKLPPSAAGVTGSMAAAALAQRNVVKLAKGITRKDLVALKELGVGMTGNVYLARVPSASGAPTLAVVKVMSKVKMLRMNQARVHARKEAAGARRRCESSPSPVTHTTQVVNVVKEKTILGQWACSQIITSLASFQDRSSLYLLLEFMAGGDLFQHLCDVRRLQIGPARFYAAEVLLALGFIHAANHVYRDLKPENILMDASGHVKLADMGFCKELRAGERTYTTCGTADYMAPEARGFGEGRGG